jgi:aspartyl-tRNA(Asn)/glutamyl-tRNA(Gln) amidotransferase subunit B
VTQEYAAASNTRADRSPQGFVGKSTGQGLADLIAEQRQGTISLANAREVLHQHIDTGTATSALIKQHGFRQISDAGALGAIVDQIIAANPGAVADVRAGKAQAIGFLVGAVMKQTRGQANAAVVQAALKARLAPDAAGERD